MKEESELENTGNVWAAFWLALAVPFVPIAWLGPILFGLHPILAALIGCIVGSAYGYRFARSKQGPIIAGRFMKAWLWVAGGFYAWWS